MFKHHKEFKESKSESNQAPHQVPPASKAPEADVNAAATKLDAELDASAAKAAAGASVSASAKLIEDLKAQLAEQQRQLLTTLADMANLRKRTEKEIASARKYALEGFSKDILETVDNLERSLQGADMANPALKGFYAGIELTLKSLREVLKRYDVVEINPLNEPFDHAKHTAIATRPADASHSVAPNTVIEVVQKGYQLKDRLLRPAMVVVSA